MHIQNIEQTTSKLELPFHYTSSCNRYTSGSGWVSPGGYGNEWDKIEMGRYRNEERREGRGGRRREEEEGGGGGRKRREEEEESKVEVGQKDILSLITHKHRHTSYSRSTHTVNFGS